MSSRTPIDDEDSALFRDAVGSVRPVADDRVQIPAVVRKRPVGERPSRRPYEVDMLGEAIPGDGPSAGERQWYATNGVAARTMRRLEQGRVRVEADLDLHGMTVEQAREAFSTFLAECQLRGLKVLRIVHGKGFGSAGARPVLKAQVDRWLRLRPEILAFCSTPPHDGGTGAVYVLLRRLPRE